jgi:hypothetical protein
MASRIIEYKGLKFEVWSKSLRLCSPCSSPMFCSYSSLEDDRNAIQAIEDFVKIMNIGIDIHSASRL